MRQRDLWFFLDLQLVLTWSSSVSARILRVPYQREQVSSFFGPVGVSTKLTNMTWVLYLPIKLKIEIKVGNWIIQIKKIRRFFPLWFLWRSRTLMKVFCLSAVLCLSAVYQTFLCPLAFCSKGTDITVFSHYGTKTWSCTKGSCQTIY